MEHTAVKAAPALPSNISDADKALIQRIRSAAERRGAGVSLVNSGNTRERSCDGKRKYRTPTYAEKMVARCSARFHLSFRYYLCPFCLCYHLTKSP